MIPFLDLKALNKPYHDLYQQELERFLESGQYILGEGVSDFETRFAQYCNCRYALGTANGLDALVLILKGLIEQGRIKPGDEVLVPANTYIASIMSVIMAGLEPVFVEPDPGTFNMDPERLTEAITAKSKVVLVVHLYGQLADMEAINSIAESRDLIVIEDAAQAHGARNSEGVAAGNFGLAAGFSFYPTKNLGALGDAGAVTTSDDELAEVIGKLRNYGRSSKHANEYLGLNSRLDDLQARWLQLKLLDLDASNESRRKMASYYLAHIKHVGIVLPRYEGRNDHVFHQFVLRVKERSRFVEYLTSKGIGTLIHYPIPPHRQQAFKAFNHLSLPVTEAIHDEVVSIPLNPTLTDDDLNYIVEQINLY